MSNDINNNENNVELTNNNGNGINISQVEANRPKTIINTNNVSQGNINSIDSTKPIVNNEFYEKEKKIWPFILIFIVVVLAGLFCYYYFVLTSPKNIIKKLFNTAYSEVKKDGLVNFVDGEINSLAIDSNFVFTSDNEQMKQLSGLTIKAGAGFDFKNKNKNYIDLDASLKDAKLINLVSSMIEGKTYIDFKNAYPKVVYIESENSLLDGDNIRIDKRYNDVLYIIEKIKDVLLNTMSEKNMSKKFLLKEIDNKKIPIIEILYKIDFQEAKKINNAICDFFINDNKALEILASIDGDEISNIKSTFQSMKDNFSELYFSDTINMALDFEMVTNNLVNLSASSKKYTMSYINGKTELNYEINYNDAGTIKITYDKNENKIFMDFKFEEGEQTIKSSITIKINSSSATKSDVSINVVVYDFADINKEMMSLSGQFKLELNKAIEPINIENAVDMMTLNEEELEKIERAMMPMTSLIPEIE